MDEIHVVDAFTDVAFKGNPAAVVLMPEERPPSWMQSVATEMRHSETAFVVVGDRQRRMGYPLRWFTPVAEVDLCGHATLAAAHVLGGRSEFITRRSGRLSCVAEGGWVDMDFPADVLDAVPTSGELSKPFGDVTVEAAARGRDDLLVQVPHEREVRGLKPDFAGIAALSRDLSVRGVIVTARQSERAFVSRCFYPEVGVPEDPVTGSAHCTLATWWSPLLGATEMMAEQASRRGGRIRLRLTDNRVHLGGQAVGVLRGELLV
ncbi:PhzF family phenazine biosynthesis protein [Streptomyces sp. AK010]|uniref:PhzF family phenazine biosynthesis protein n=1 Tax=Streptomyces sp. AK010 TaxID=2723074 RepID=UPI00161797C8|nr:PhzF family phenazine biosynthesis isomerase [Streptomyces sp. AK010]MBB6416056.1 putative PhzF superfamily epimerase YddE/YHI9 [Streptomyces sp. AK010]